MTAEELSSVIDYDTAIERLQLVRDLFVFSCYTGIAYCDMVALTEDNLIKGYRWKSMDKQQAPEDKECV